MGFDKIKSAFDAGISELAKKVTNGASSVGSVSGSTIPEFKGIGLNETFKFTPDKFTSFNPDKLNFVKPTLGKINIFSTNVLQNYRNAIAGGLSTGATVRVALSGAARAGAGAVASLASTKLSALGIGTTGEVGLAVGGGLALGVALTSKKVSDSLGLDHSLGHYVGLEYVGNKIGDKAFALFGRDQKTNSKTFEVVDSVFQYLGL